MSKEVATLKVKEVKKEYVISHGSQHRVIRALDDVTFELSNGLYGLLGPNGAGKSTLINIIIGNLAPDSGAVFWNGKSTVKLGKRYRQLLGYMPQQQTLYDGFTGFRFLQYICALKEVSKKQINEEIERVAATVNLSDELGKRLSAYSGGMRQRILAAAAMLGNPQLLILDEPTAGLDPKERVRFREMMKSYAEQAIILLATHVVSDVEQAADVIIMLNKGKIALMDTPANLVKQTTNCNGLEDVYLSVFGEE